MKSPATRGAAGGIERDGRTTSNILEFFLDPIEVVQQDSVLYQDVALRDLVEITAAVGVYPARINTFVYAQERQSDLLDVIVG